MNFPVIVAMIALPLDGTFYDELFDLTPIQFEVPAPEIKSPAGNEPASQFFEIKMNAQGAIIAIDGMDVQSGPLMPAPEKEKHSLGIACFPALDNSPAAKPHTFRFVKGINESYREIWLQRTEDDRRRRRIDGLLIRYRSLASALLL